MKFRITETADNRQGLDTGLTRADRALREGRTSFRKGLDSFRAS